MTAATTGGKRHRGVAWRSAAQRSKRRDEARRGLRQAEGSEDQTSCGRVEALRLTNTCLSGSGASPSLSFVRHLHGAQYHSVLIQKPFSGSHRRTPLHPSPKVYQDRWQRKPLSNIRVMLDTTDHLESGVSVCGDFTVTQDCRFIVETSLAIGVSGRRIPAITRRAAIEAVGVLGSR